MHLVSVIIPIYNVAPFLKRCVDSVVCQTYSNMEILLIDDGSTDESPIICDEYACKYDIVRVIHKSNGGVGSARNLGIEISKGDYITFVDSDDAVQCDYIEKMYRNAIQYNTSISCCLLDVIELDGSKLLNKSCKTGLYQKKNIIIEYFDNQFIKDIMYGPYNKLIKRSLLKNVRFKPYKMGEDILFIFELLQECDNVYIDNYVGYHYFHREGSAMKSSFSSSRLDYIFAGEEMFRISCERSPYVSCKVEKWLFKHILITLKQIYINNKISAYKEFYKSNKKKLFNNVRLFKTLNFMRKIDYIALFFFPCYFKFVSSIKKINGKQ